MVNEQKSDLPVLLWLTDDVDDWLHGWGAGLVPLHGEAVELHVAVPVGQGVRLADANVPFVEVPLANGADGLVQAPALVSVMERISPQVVHVDVAAGLRRARLAAQIAGVPLLSESWRAQASDGEAPGGGRLQRLAQRVKGRVESTIRRPDCTVLEFRGPDAENPDWTPMETSCGVTIDPPAIGTRPGFTRGAADRFVLLVDARGIKGDAQRQALAQVNRIVASSAGSRVIVIPPSDGPSVWDACRGLVVLPASMSDDAALLSCDAYLMPVASRFALRTAMRASALGKPILGVDTESARYVVRDGETGVLSAAAGDTFARSVAEVTANPGQLEWLGEKGRRFARRAFDRDVVLTRLLSLWDRRMSRLASDDLTVDSSGNLFSEPADERRVRDHIRNAERGRS